MKCVKLIGKRQFAVSEIEEPTPQEGYVTIDVKKAGICGSDIHYWDIGEPKGLVLGHEYCGIVTNPGNREDLKVGDRVTALPISPCMKCSACLKGNIQYCKETWTYATGLSLTNPGALAPQMNIREDMVLKVPDNITDEEVAMVEPTAVGLHGIHLADIKVGDKVLVIGGGIIGLVSAMFAKKEGASFVVVSETNDLRAQKALDLEVADKVYDAKTDISAQIIEDTHDGFDVVIECCGNDKAVTSAILATKPGGTVVLVGVSMVPITIPTVSVVMSELTVKGVIGYTKEEFAMCIELMANQKIDTKKFISDIVSLEDVQSSYERLTSGNDDAIKILVDPNK